MFNYKINVEGGNPFIGSGKLDGAGIPADFFSDIHVRKGFAYAFDMNTYIKDALLGEAVQGKGPIIQGLLGYDTAQAVYTFDKAKAEAELKQAWGGKVWETGFYIQLAYNTGNETRRLAAEILKKGLESLNPKFSVAVLNLPWPTYLSVRREKKLPISVSGWLQDYADPSNWTQPFMDCKAGAYAVAQGFPAAFCTKVDELHEKGVASVDPKVREPIYKELQNLTYTEAISIFLAQTTGRHYEQSWIQGWYNHPLYPGYYLYALSKVSRPKSLNLTPFSPLIRGEKGRFPFLSSCCRPVAVARGQRHVSRRASQYYSRSGYVSLYCAQIVNSARSFFLESRS